MLTDAVDEYARKDQVEDVKCRSSSQSYLVSNIWIRFQTAGVVFGVFSRGELKQVEFTVCLVIAHVSLFALPLQLQLHKQHSTF